MHLLLCEQLIQLKEHRVSRDDNGVRAGDTDFGSILFSCQQVKPQDVED